MITKSRVKELLDRAREVATWIHKNTDKAETGELLRRFWAAIHAVENELSEDRGGYVLLVENAKRGRRVTITVETADRYVSRTGWEAAGVDAEVVYSQEVSSLSAAREELKRLCPKEQFTAFGMEWTQTPARELKLVIDSIARL